MDHLYKADVAIIGGGLAGLAVAAELLDCNKSVIILERDSPENLGGLAKRSFGGVLLVDTPEQRRMQIRDSPDLAFRDWLSYAEFEEGDNLPRQWALEYVHRSSELIYTFLKQRQLEFLPVVNWPERGLFRRGNSVPRWHITWGTGKEIITKTIAALNGHAHRQKMMVYYHHRVEGFTKTRGVVNGCFGKIEGSADSFAAEVASTVIASGGICGGDLSLVRKYWPAHFGAAPKRLLNGAHRFGDGLLHHQTRKIGGNVTNLEKQWHYAAGIQHPKPQQIDHGLSLVPPRSALWVDALGRRLGQPLPAVAYTDTSYLVEQVAHAPGGYSWLILNDAIARKELAVSGSEYMTAFANKKKLQLLLNLLWGNRSLVARLKSESVDFISAKSLKELVQRMNDLETSHQVDYPALHSVVQAYDSEIQRGQAYFNDEQLRRILNFRTYKGDRLRICKFQRINDPRAGSLIAIRVFILARKSLGGIETDLSSRVLTKSGKVIPGLFAAGEAAGFGGGGIHGRRALEGTFLGGCILTGRIAGNTIARDV